VEHEQMSQPNTLPAHIANRQNRGLAQQVSLNLGTTAPPYLSIEGGRFTLYDSAGNSKLMTGMDEKLGVFIDVCIVDILERKSRVYYAQDYNPSATSWAPPDCWSDNGIGPSRQCSSPQSPTCAACPMAVWGSEVSRVTGKGIPACNEQQKIAFLVPGFEQLFLLRIPPNSLKHFKAYGEQFRGRPFDMDAVLTRIAFQKEGQGTLIFVPASYTPEPVLALADKVIAAKAADGMLGRMDQPIQGLVLPPNRPTQQIEHQGQPVNPAQQSAQFHPNPAPAPQQPVQQAQTAAPAPRGRRRNPPAGAVATEQPATVQATQAPAQPAQAPFRQETPNPGFGGGTPFGQTGQTSETPVATSPNGGGTPATTFGFAAGGQAPAEIAQNLDNLFGPR
jgi:hypothetical protein